MICELFERTNPVVCAALVVCTLNYGALLHSRARLWLSTAHTHQFPGPSRAHQKRCLKRHHLDTRKSLDIMVSVRKRKMARSSVKKNTRRTKDKQRAPKIAHHPVLRAKWDKNLTLKQNYEKLGLTSRLSKYNGGQESSVKTISEYRKEQEENEAAHVAPEDVAVETDPLKIPEGEARLIRDPETNEVVQVIYGTMKIKKEEGKPKTESGIVEELIEYEEQHAKKKKPLTPKEEEADMLEALYEKYDDDYEKMKWDKKLNPLFLSVGQLKKKIAVWKKANGVE